MVIVGRYNRPDGGAMYAIGLFEPDRNYLPFGDGGDGGEISYDLPDEWMRADDFAVGLDTMPAYITEEEACLEFENAALKQRIEMLEQKVSEWEKIEQERVSLLQEAIGSRSLENLVVCFKRLQAENAEMQRGFTPITQALPSSGETVEFMELHRGCRNGSMWFHIEPLSYVVRDVWTPDLTAPRNWYEVRGVTHWRPLAKGRAG